MIVNKSGRKILNFGANGGEKLNNMFDKNRKQSNGNNTIVVI
jgi:hypothetical protein